MGRHALLSASSAHRWLSCPPSAKLCAEVPDKGSEYAAEGTDAHSLCEYKVLKYLGKEVGNPIENLSFYDEEMERCTSDYAAYISEIVEEVKDTCKDLNKTSKNGH